MAIIEVLSGGSLMGLSAMAHREDFDVISTELPVDLFTSDKCPDVVKVFADDSDESYRNDFSSFLIDAGIYEVAFTLEKDCEHIADLNDNTYGWYFPKGVWDTASGFSPQQSKYTSYILLWDKVRDLHGVGHYSVKMTISFTVGGLPVATLCSCTFLLQTFDKNLADKTIRIRTVQDGHILSSFDYTGLQFPQCWRMNGFFGYPQDKLEVDNYLDKNRNITQIQDTLFKEYTLQTDFINDCQKNIFNDILLSNKIFIDDYNIKNAYYLADVPVIPTQSDSSYYVESTDTFKEITFEDRERKTIKRNVK